MTTRAIAESRRAAPRSRAPRAAATAAAAATTAAAARARLRRRRSTAAADRPARHGVGVPAGGDAAGRPPSQTTVYPILRQYCAHVPRGRGPGLPHIAHPDVETAFRAVVDHAEGEPAPTRAARASCAGSPPTSTSAGATARRTAGDAGRDRRPGPRCVAAAAPPDRQRRHGRRRAGRRDLERRRDARRRRGGSRRERYDDNLIALWDFKEGTGTIAHDTSGVAPADGPRRSRASSWVSGDGIEIETGKAERHAATRAASSTTASRPRQTGTQQYSVEAWVIPANTTQEGPARIITYSANTRQRATSTSGQTLYTVRLPQPQRGCRRSAATASPRS